MRGILWTLLLLGCAAQSRSGRTYKDVPVAVAIAAGTGSVVAGAATAVVVTAAVGVVVVGAEQFPDPPAGTPEISTAPKDPPNLCRSCRCWGRGKGPGLPGLYEVPDGSGYIEHTRATCQEVCDADHYNGFDCSGDKGKITWFRP